MMTEVRKVKDIVHDLVDKGVTTVEGIHRSIAQASGEGLEEVAPQEVKSYVAPAKEIHDTATGAVYDTIRMINRKVCEISDEILAKVEDASLDIAETVEEAVDPEEREEL